MAKTSTDFLLNFNDSHWSFEDAVPAIFLGDWEADQRKRLSPDLILVLLNEGEGRALGAALPKERLEGIAALHDFLINKIFKPSLPSRERSLSPIIWCRIAIQFWLMHGGRQEIFVSAMTRWIKSKHKEGAAYVVYRSANEERRKKIPMEAFLFGGVRLPPLLETEWEYKHTRNSQQQPKQQNKKGGKRSDKDQVGAHLLSAVKHAVSEVIGKKRGESLYLRSTDKETGKHRYRGTKYDLLEEICPAGKDSGGRWRLANGNGISLYAESTLMKAISKVAICRKSWPG